MIKILQRNKDSFGTIAEKKNKSNFFFPNHAITIRNTCLALYYQANQTKR
jgi:hypothetical protein